MVAGEPKAKVIPLHGDPGRAAAQRRAAQRADAASRHPSLLSDPGSRASAEEMAAGVREIDAHRGAGGAAAESPPEPNELAKRIASVAEFVRRRLTGDYS